MKKYHIRVNHSLGFFSFYDIEAENHWEAEREARKMFLNQFCGGVLDSKHTLETYTFNK